MLRGSTDFWRSKKLFWDTLAVHSTNIVMVICFCLNCVCFNFDIPVAADTLGGLHSVAVEQVKKLGSSLARHQGQEEEEVIRHLFQRLSLVLMRGNAQLLVNRMPPESMPDGEIDGTL